MEQPVAYSHADDPAAMVALARMVAARDRDDCLAVLAARELIGVGAPAGWSLFVAGDGETWAGERAFKDFVMRAPFDHGSIASVDALAAALLASVHLALDGSPARRALA